MNKAELIQAVAEDLVKEGAIPRAIIERVLNSEQKVIKTTVIKGESVKLVGFGTYEAREQAARNVKNPRNKKVQAVEAKMAPKFNPAKEWKDDVAEKLPIPTN